jgi:hypothetical protein
MTRSIQILVNLVHAEEELAILKAKVSVIAAYRGGGEHAHTSFVDGYSLR